MLTAGRTASLVADRAVPAVVRWGFYGFIFSLPFEYPGRTIPVEVTTLTAALFLLTTLVAPRACYGRAPAVLWLFAAYLWVLLVAFVTNGGQYPTEVSRLCVLLVQAVLVFWAASNLFRVDGLARNALLTLAVACVIWSALQLSGWASTASVVETGGERLSVMGQNPNHTARILTVGLLALVGLGSGRGRAAPRARWLVWPIVGVLALAILQTGSRGALLALAAGLMTFGFGARTLGLKLRNACAVALALGLLTWATYNTDVMRNRLLRSAEKGTLAGRERIYPALWQMFLEKPLVGWGPIANKYELGSRPGQTRARRDAHNVGLEVLTASGLLGAIPFLSGLGICSAAAWRARRGPRGSLPLALATAVLVGSMSMNWIAALPFWLVLAYGTASGAPMPASVAAVAPRYRALTAVRRGVA